MFTFKKQFCNQNNFYSIKYSHISKLTAIIGPILSTGSPTASRTITRFVIPGPGIPAAPIETNVLINLKKTFRKIGNYKE